MTLDDRLPELVGKTLDHSTRRMPGEVQMYKMYVENAKEAILSDLLQIIGVDDIDEKYKHLVGEDAMYDVGRDDLRQELRQKVRDYCK